MARLKTLTVKIPAALSLKVAGLAKKRHTTKSEVVRDALEAVGAAVRPSFTEAAAEQCGAARGPGDLSTNPNYLDDYGK